MPGTISFRPIEANLTHDTNWLGRMDPYCLFTLGTQKVRSQVCKHGSTRPHWDDVVTLQAVDVPSVVNLEILNKDKLRPDASIAAALIDLTELQTLGSSSKWYPVYHHKKLAGEVLIEAVYQPEQIITQTVVPTTTVVETVTMVPTQTLNQEVPFETFGQQPLVGQTITQVTNLGGLPVDQGFTNLQSGVPLQGENFGLMGNQFESGLPTTQTLGGLPQGQFIEGQNLGLINNTNPGLLASKTSLLGPQGGFPHGHRLLGGATNAGYSVRPGYTLGTVEPNPTCQSNVDTNGGGFFNKPGRERRAEPYTLSNPGTYGIPHGDTIDTAGHLQPNVMFDRPAPIGQLNQPGITGYPDGFNHGAGAIPPRNLNQDSFPLRDKI